MAKVVVLDDDKAVREMARDVLAADGHEVVEFSVPADAVAYLTNRANPVPDVLLTDVMMPGASGYEVLGALQQDERCRHWLKVVVFTSKGALEGIFADSKNVVSFILKPFTIATLRDKIRAAAALPKPG